MPSWVGSIAVDKSGKYIYITYQTYRIGEWPRQPNTYLARSVDGGETFETNIRVDNAAYGPYHGGNSVAVDNDGNVYVVWEERMSGSRIFMAKSIDHGATFLPKVRVVEASPFYDWSDLLLAPDVTVDDAGRIYVVYLKGSWYKAQTVLVVSENGGTTFSAEKIIDPDFLPQGVPVVTAKGDGEVFVAWGDSRRGSGSDIYLYRSTDNGKSFISPVQINDNVAPGSSAFSPSLAVGENGIIFVAWVGSTNLGTKNIYGSWSEDNGVTFNPSVKVNNTLTLPGVGDGTPSVAADKTGQVFIVWTDSRNGNPDIYFAASGIPNQLPVANAGIDRGIECSNISGTSVILDGSGSSDPDGNPLTYTWSWNNGIAEGVSPMVSLPLGTTVVMLTVSDGKATATDAVTITVSDSTPPVTTATGGSEDWYNANVISTFSASDSCSGVKEVRYSVDGSETVVSGNYASATITTEGTHNVTYYAVDNAGNMESSKSMTVKIDKTPPVLNLSTNPNILWPPNHKMTDVTIGGGASDNLSGVDSVTFTVKDEYGTVQPSISGFNTSIALEAWRNGSDKDGRHYTITATATDAAGNKSTASTEVLVPHDQR
jgi:hypothetical protein